MSVIYIGSAIGNQGIYGRLWDRVRDPEGQFDPGSKEAWRSGLTIEVSWAETTNAAEAKRHEAALLHEYQEKHGHLPYVVLDGEPTPGNKVLPSLKGKPTGCLTWSDWEPLYHVRYSPEESKQLLKDVPPSPGLYRFRVAESDHANAPARTPVPSSKRASSPRTSLTIDDAVMDYWRGTGRRTNDARILYLMLCECCKVIFPSGLKRKGRIICARCRPKWSAGKPCLHP